MGSLRVGVSHADITPPTGTPMEGYIERKGVSQGVHDGLFAKAMVLEDVSGKKIAIVSVDLIGVAKWIVDFARKRIESNTGIQRKNIMIAATHTHSGPRGIVDFFTGENAFSKGFFSRELSEMVGSRIVESVVSADKRLKVAKIGLGIGNVTGLCSNRTSLDGPVDSGVSVVRLDSTDSGKSIGCIVNYACHPTVLGAGNLFFSADFPAYMRDTVEPALDGKLREAEAIYLNGASGNLSTRFTRKASTFAEAERIGKALGLEVLRAMKTVKKMSDNVEVSAGSEVIKLPQRKLPSLDFVKKDLKRGEEMLRQLKIRGASAAEMRTAESLVEGAKVLLAAYDYMSKFEGRDFEVEIQLFKLGEVATLCATPSELFVEYGLQIRRELKQLNPLIVGYANGFTGYVLTERAYREGGYEALSTFLDADAGAKIVKKIEEIADRLLP